MGSLVCIADDVDCYAVGKIKIGSKVTVSQRSFLCTASHETKTLRRELFWSDIEIGDHAWVCAESFVGPGVVLGEGAMVAARAVVVKQVDPWTIVGGNPAKVIKQRVLDEDVS